MHENEGYLLFFLVHHHMHKETRYKSKFITTTAVMASQKRHKIIKTVRDHANALFCFYQSFWIQLKEFKVDGKNFIECTTSMLHFEAYTEELRISQLKRIKIDKDVVCANVIKLMEFNLQTLFLYFVANYRISLRIFDK